MSVQHQEPARSLGRHETICPECKSLMQLTKRAPHLALGAADERQVFMCHICCHRIELNADSQKAIPFRQTAMLASCPGSSHDRQSRGLLMSSRTHRPTTAAGSSARRPTAVPLLFGSLAAAPLVRSRGSLGLEGKRLLWTDDLGEQS
jgi:hypothetical protein